MLKGKGVSEGIGLGKVVILRNEKIKPEKVQIENVILEKEKFYKAISKVQNEIEELIKKISGTEKDIMQAYLMILQDPTLIQETIEIIEKEKCNAAYATEIGFNTIIQTFEEMDDPYMAARSADIADMKKKVLYKILNKEEINLSQLPSNTILITSELTTSDTAKLNLNNIAGIITEVGGVNSHMAIMARTHEIPAVVGVKQIIKQIKDGDLIAINGETGEIFINPSKEEWTRFEEIRENSKKEKEQFEAYKKVAEKLQNKRIVIRTLDIGGDKNLKYMKLPKEDNPFLGYRAIRIFLDNISLFKVQLRAILRASAYGNLAIMIPMISSIEELRESKKIIQEVKDELRTKQIPFNKNIEIGIMIEIPSAALMAEELAKECDFFSIGTNDLIQYTIAVERGNEKVSNLYTHFHPAVIRLIKSTIDGAHKNNIICGMCGEAAGDPMFIPLLIGLGLDEFSMNANKILQARKLIRELNFQDCKQIAQNVLKLNSSEEVKLNLLKNDYI